MHRIVQLSLLATTCCVLTIPAFAEDARSLALGGSVIANGKGAHGALENPASMMAMKRRGESLHLRFGMSGEVRDTGGAIDTLSDEDNQDLITDIDSEITALSETNIECAPPTVGPDDICIRDTQNLSDLSGRLLDIIDLVDGEAIDGQARADLGVAYTKSTVPFAIHLRGSATGSGQPEIAQGDREYIADFENLLDDNAITVGEIQESDFLEVDQFGQPLIIDQPENILKSQVTANALQRTQLGLSFATSLDVEGVKVDVGITPKFSSLKAYRLKLKVADEFLDDAESVADRFKDSEVSRSSFTFDIGASTILTKLGHPITLSTVLKNVIPESIKTIDGYKFETDPQLIIGAALQQGMLTFSGDLALNAAKVDNFETQKIALGIEFGTRLLALRGGLSHDAAREKDATALSLGFALGPLELGGRLSDAESLEAGIQLAFSFK